MLARKLATKCMNNCPEECTCWHCIVWVFQRWTQQKMNTIPKSHLRQAATKQMNVFCEDLDQALRRQACQRCVKPPSRVMFPLCEIRKLGVHMLDSCTPTPPAHATTTTPPPLSSVWLLAQTQSKDSDRHRLHLTATIQAKTNTVDTVKRSNFQRHSSASLNGNAHYSGHVQNLSYLRSILGLTRTTDDRKKSHVPFDRRCIH